MYHFSAQLGEFAADVTSSIPIKNIAINPQSLFDKGMDAIKSLKDPQSAGDEDSQSGDSVANGDPNNLQSRDFVANGLPNNLQSHDSVANGGPDSSKNSTAFGDSKNSTDKIIAGAENLKK